MDFTVLLPLLGLVFISLISPGPDFTMTVKNSLIYSRRSGLLTAVGISTALLIHISYTLLGLGILIAHTPILLRIVQYTGAIYLFYIGYKNLLSKNTLNQFGGRHAKHDLSPWKAFSMGFITNLFNPKAILFFVSLFSVMMPENSSTALKASLGAGIFIETIMWFSFVAFCLSGKKTRTQFQKISHWIERITGVILIGLAIKLFFTQLGH